MFSHISVPGHELRLANPEDLAAVKALDDAAFGGHHGISLDELQTLVRQGAVIVLINECGEMVGESEVLLGAMPKLPYRPAPDEAYYYGTARRPDCKGMGIGKVLAEAQDAFARANGRTHASLTVRVENLSSIRLRLATGFTITRYLPAFYGGELESARLFMSKSLVRTEARRYSDELFAPVRFGEALDPRAHRLIEVLLAHGFCGYAVLDDGICFGK